MKLTLIRTDRETGKETFSLLEAEALIEKLKRETQSKHVSVLRSLIPALEGSNGHYRYIDKLPRIYPAAVPFCLEQPLSMPGEITFKEHKQAETNPLLRLEPGYQASETFAMLFEAALNRAFADLTDWKRGDDLRPLLYRLAEHCFRAGIPEEEVVRQTLMHYYHEAEEPIVRATLHNLYQECKGFGTRSSMNAEQETASAGWRARVSEIYLLPNHSPTPTALRLHRQHRLQKQAGRRTKPGTLLPDKYR